MSEIYFLVAVTTAIFILLNLLFLMQKIYLNLLRQIGGKTLVWIPASIFVPIHEISHLLMAWACGHKVKSITLFSFNDSGTLGSVEHTYRPSFLSHFTNMAIGLAPILGGGVTLYGIIISSNLLFPDPSLFILQLSGVQVFNIASFLWQIVSNNGSYWQFWMTLYLSVNVVVFSIPSKQDFKGAGVGLIITTSLVLLISSIDAGQGAYQFLSMAFQTTVLPVMLTALCVSAIINLILYIIAMIMKWLRGHKRQT